MFKRFVSRACALIAVSACVVSIGLFGVNAQSGTTNAVQSNAPATGNQPRTPEHGNAQTGTAGVGASGAGAKTAAQQFKNVQVLKDIPAGQLIPSMQFISAALGVQCEFCHVQNGFERDDKDEKKTARMMIQMVQAINRDHFKGEREVTCYTCHHGSARASGTPVLQEASAGAASGQPGGTGASADRDIDGKALVTKFIDAIGGPAALAKISSFAEKGTITVDGKPQAVQVFEQAPDKRVSVVQMASGESVTAFNGTDGWLVAPNGRVREMSPEDAAGAKLDAQFFLPVNLAQMFSQYRVRGIEKVNGKDATLVVGTREGQPPVRMYFDPQSSLLVRMVRYTDSPLGLVPFGIDFSDYTAQAGVKMPTTWTVLRAGNAFTIRADSVQINAPVPQERLTKPPGQ